MNRMEYLNKEAQKFGDLFNTPERLDRLQEGVTKSLSLSYGWEVGPLRLRFSVTKIPSYAFSYETGGGENPQFVVQLVGPNDYAYINVLIFSISTYPHCCGMMQLNGFSHNLAYREHEILSQEEMEQVMAAFVEIYRTEGDHRLVRVMMNMVERRPFVGRDDMREVEPVKDPYIQYSAFWKWAHNQRRVRDMLMVNGNSGNILHHMEVILK